MKLSRYLAAVAAALALLTGITIIASPADKEARNQAQALTRELTTFNAIVRELADNYVDTIPLKRMFRAATGAMFAQLDPYTESYSADEREDFKTMTTGQYAGIGSYILQRPDSTVLISNPYEDSPARRAGLRAGDVIVRIDTTDVRHAGSPAVSSMLRGQPGSIVKVTVERPYAGPDSVFTFDIKREKLDLPSVPYAGVTRAGLGYIKLTSYMEKSPQEVRRALEQFKANPEVKGVVLDLRGNGGGLVESAVEIVGFFVPKGTEVLRMKGREQGNDRIYRTTKKPIMPDMPLAVLIDGGSASASEITAGALQDLDRAVLIGSRSFGKGLVQSTRPLPFDGLLKVTTQKYYIPSGRLIQALDYSHRNPDGSVAEIPDSLCSSFTTRAGRIVKDGGGLKPDVEVKWDMPTPLVMALVSDQWIFNYGTKYAATHPSIPSPEEFTVTDEIFADFKASVDTTRLKYDKRSEQMLATLRTTAEKEGVLNDSVKALLDDLSLQLRPDIDRDFAASRKLIDTYLAYELLGRYYFTRGECIYDLRDDRALDRAAELLLNPAGLNKILSAPGK